MGFRFRKSVRVLPGVRLNLSTRGASTSIGGRGATLNIGRKGARATVGPPGTGLSYSSGLFGGSRRISQAQAADDRGTGTSLLGWIVSLALLLLVGSCIAALSPLGRVPTPPPATGSPALPMKTVAAKSVNCRMVPISGTVLAKFDSGTELAVVGQQAGWTKVMHMGGDCWVSDALLR